jgi:hypothetical protein
LEEKAKSKIAPLLKHDKMEEERECRDNFYAF